MWQAQPAPNCLGIDLDQPVTGRLLDVLDYTTLPVGAAAPFRGLAAADRLPIRGIGRYVSLHEPEAAGDALAGELALIAARGYAAWLVQHVLDPGWVASAQLGADLGGAARDNAARIGYRPGCHLAIDVEGTASRGDAVVEFIEAWAAETTQLYPALEYVGYGSGLSADEHYFSLGSVHLYWGAPGPWDVTRRHFAVRQGRTIQIGGFAVDPDGIGEDAFGGRLTWMVDPEAVNRRFPNVS